MKSNYLKCCTTVTAPNTTRGARIHVKRMWIAYVISHGSNNSLDINQM